MTRRLHLLLAALLTALALAPGHATADAQNRVGAFPSAAPSCTQADAAGIPCKHQASPPGSARIAAGCCVAAKDAGAVERGAADVVGRRGSPLEIRPGTNAPGEIGGRPYSGHALDRMQGRGIPPSAVEEAIANGESAAGRGGSTIHYGPDNHVSVVVGRNGRVVTVGYGRFKP